MMFDSLRAVRPASSAPACVWPLLYLLLAASALFLSPAAAQGAGEEAEVEMPEKGKPFILEGDLSMHSLGAILPVIAGQRELNYVVTSAARKLLQKRWQVPLASHASVKPEGPHEVSWERVQQQLHAAGAQEYLFRVGNQTTLEVSSAREILLVVNKSGKLPTREGLKDVPADLDVHLLARANAVILEGAPASLRTVRRKLSSTTSAWNEYAALLPDNDGKYVLTYPLLHAWAQDGMTINALVSGNGPGTLASKPRGIVNALSSVIKDYVGAPRVVGAPRLVAADGGRAAAMLQSYQKAGIPGFESEESLRLMVDGLTQRGQSVRLETVPQRRETDSEVLARPLAPLGAASVTLLPSGAVVETPAAAAATAADRQDAIEDQFGSKLLALPADTEASAPGKGVLTGGDAVTDRNDQVPTLAPWTVLADQANNALVVITPPLLENAVVLDFLRYLDGMVGILDEPVSMVEIVAEIMDVDTNKLEEWGPRFALATGGKLGGWPSFTRSGFDVPGNTPPGAGFATILDPTTGLSKITAETVAGEGLNVGALLVGSSVRLLATFRALETDANTHVDARPAVVTLDNTDAEISAKTSIFIPSVGLNVSALSQVDVPISIKVLPQVIEPRPGSMAVSMRIQVEDGSQPANTPVTVNYSKLATSAIVASGESVLLAGRRRHLEADRRRRVPGVSRVPVAGKAFQNSAVADQYQQRLILITPRIVQPLSQRQRLEQRRRGDGSVLPDTVAAQAATAAKANLLAPANAGAPSAGSGAPADPAAAEGTSARRHAPSATPSVRLLPLSAAP